MSSIHRVLAALAFAGCIAICDVEHTSAQVNPAPPMTPGSVALAGVKPGLEALKTIERALADPDPAVRVVAARLVAVSKFSSLKTAVSDALAQEQDAGAALEQVRALLMIADAPSVEAAAKHLARGRAAAVHVYADWLVRNNSDQLADRLAELASPLSAKEAAGLGKFVIERTVQDSRPVDRVLRSWLSIVTTREWTASLMPWREALDALGAELGPSEATVLRDALVSDRVAIRQQTVWAIVMRLARKQAVDPSLLDAALPRSVPLDARDNDGLWEAFGRELVGRQQGQRDRSERAEVIRKLGAEYVRDTQAAVVLGLLTRGERSAVSSALGEQRSEPKLAMLAVGRAASTVGRRATLATVDLLSPGLLPSLLDAAGCEAPSEPKYGGLEVTYGPDRAPTRVQIDIGNLPASCEPVLRALARLRVADLDYSVAQGSQWLILPLFKDFIQCSESQLSYESAARLRTRDEETQLTLGSPKANIQPPTKTRHVTPDYPPSAMRSGLQGMVAVETTIGPTGCIASGRVTQSPGMALDLAAMLAVLRWQFTPTLVNGRPVPVVMTVTVNFTLK